MGRRNFNLTGLDLGDNGVFRCSVENSGNSRQRVENIAIIAIYIFTIVAIV